MLVINLIYCRFLSDSFGWEFDWNTTWWTESVFLFPDVLKIFQENWVEKYGRIYRVWFGPEPVVMISSAKYIEVRDTLPRVGRRILAPHRHFPVAVPQLPHRVSSWRRRRLRLVVANLIISYFLLTEDLVKQQTHQQSRSNQQLFRTLAGKRHSHCQRWVTTTQ